VVGIPTRLAKVFAVTTGPFARYPGCMLLAVLAYCFNNGWRSAEWWRSSHRTDKRLAVMCLQCLRFMFHAVTCVTERRVALNTSDGGSIFTTPIAEQCRIGFGTRTRNGSRRGSELRLFDIDRSGGSGSRSGSRSGCGSGCTGSGRTSGCGSRHSGYCNVLLLMQLSRG